MLALEEEESTQAAAEKAKMPQSLFCHAADSFIRQRLIEKQKADIIPNTAGLSNVPVNLKKGLFERIIRMNCMRATIVSIKPIKRNDLVACFGCATKERFPTTETAHQTHMNPNARNVQLRLTDLAISM